MRCRHGRVLVGQRAVHIVPNLRSRNISVCTVMSKSCIVLYKKESRAFNTSSFSLFIEDLMVKFREIRMDHAIIVMDNVPFHHGTVISEIIERNGHVLKFLPAYSPFLNPIAHYFPNGSRSFVA
jgi:hypothetical protein